MTIAVSRHHLALPALRVALVPAAVVALTLAGLWLRLSVIAHWPGAAYDLRLYRYFADILRAGGNPYQAPASGPYPPAYSDMSPANLAVFAAVLWWRDDPLALRLAFLVVDAALVLVLGFLPRRPASTRLALAAFVALNPLIWLAWTATTEDKDLVLLLLVLVMLAIEAGQPWAVWLATAALTAYKALGLPFIPLILWRDWRARGWHGLLPAVVAGVLVLATAVLPYFPASLNAVHWRSARLALNPPVHESVTRVLATAGLYTPRVGQLLTAAALLTVYALWWRGRLPLVAAVAWSVVAANVFAPEVGLDRLLLVTLPLPLVVRLSPARWLALWALTLALAAWWLWTPASLAYALACNAPLLLLAGWAVADALSSRAAPCAAPAPLAPGPA